MLTIFSTEKVLCHQQRNINKSSGIIHIHINMNTTSLSSWQRLLVLLSASLLSNGNTNVAFAALSQSDEGQYLSESSDVRIRVCAYFTFSIF